jgi:hypothetical protein
VDHIKLLTLVSGLPGSGKSHWLRARRGSSIVFDDFKAHAIADDWHFTSACSIGPLLSALGAGVHCFVADIDFCDPSRRQEALDALNEHIPPLAIAQVCFANDRRQCEVNVRAAAGRNMGNRLAEIARLSPVYVIPDGASIIPVWAPPVVP